MEKQKEKVALSSVLASLFLMCLKLFVGIATGSIGIISEALHSGLDLVAALITYSAVKISKKPADSSHHFGHGKVESLSALGETALLFITSGWIVYEAVRRLVFKSVEIEVTWYAFLVMFISIIVDLSRSRALKNVAKKTNSQALEADALHFSSDIYSSSVVILGLILFSFGIKGADSFAAIGVAILVVFVSYRLGRRTIDVLIDAAPKELTRRIKDTVLKTNGVVNVERLRLRPAGGTFFIDMNISVSRKIPLAKVNKITKNIQYNVRRIIPRADVIVHIKPVVLADETIVEQIQIISANAGLSTHDISVQTLNGKKIVNFDLEVDNTLDLEKAHQKATRLENTIQKELGEDIEINTHIEPVKPATILSSTIDTKKMAEINKIVNKVGKELKLVDDIHNISARKVGDKIFISLHCTLNPKTSLEEAHNLTSRMEYLIKDRLPGVVRTIVHIEPAE